MNGRDEHEGRVSRQATEGERRPGEAGFIFVGGGGNGCAGRGCLFWIVLSIVASVLLTVGVNLVLAVF
ncbi:hypothetical protein [Rubrobacter indicoceani]|uniref:hypothetical protein n=1 Tax=Rubrobacter indicoceani TaxID=2051957 RepID=UPI000E5B5248|nr:hypothetical protein [Rubrobacter indicoceani]